MFSLKTQLQTSTHIYRSMNCIIIYYPDTLIKSLMKHLRPFNLHPTKRHHHHLCENWIGTWFKKKSGRIIREVANTKRLSSVRGPVRATQEADIQQSKCFFEIVWFKMIHDWFSLVMEISLMTIDKYRVTLVTHPIRRLVVVQSVVWRRSDSLLSDLFIKWVKHTSMWNDRMISSVMNYIVGVNAFGSCLVTAIEGIELQEEGNVSCWRDN